MASFQKVRQIYKSSASAEDFCAFCDSSTAGLLQAAAGTATAHTELATLQGNPAVRTTPKHPTRALRAPQPAAALVGTSTITRCVA